MHQKRVFHVGHVSRADAGGPLVAPVDQHGREHGITPSYDGAAMQRVCDKLNGTTRRKRDKRHS